MVTRTMDVRARIGGTPLHRRVSDASPFVSDHAKKPSFTPDFDNCGKMPNTTIDFRSSSAVQHLARMAGS